MGFTLPKLRADLTIRAQESKGATVFVVKDPVNGRFFRFGEAEEFILRQLDGETSLDVIRRRAREAFGGELDPEVLASFVKEIYNSGLLLSENQSQQASTSRKRRFKGNILFLRCKLFDPTSAFDLLQSLIRFCFTPYFLIFSGLVIALAMDAVIVNAEDLTNGLGTLVQPSAIPLYILFALITVGLHEFAHGLTCRFFGGEVHEIGFLLIYFQPALYCNVSDAWLFPEKSKRLWVSFAGPYFELFVWAIAVLVWRASEPGTTINQCAMMITAISGFKTLLNFNPLIKLDGYYILSDALEISNLRAKAFRSVGDLLLAATGRKRQGDIEESRRDRFICLSYGLVAVTGSFAILGSLVISVFKYLGAESGSLLLLAPVLFGLFTRIKMMIVRLFDRNSAGAGLDEGDDDPQPASPARERSSAAQGRPGWISAAAWAVCFAIALFIVAARPVRVSAVSALERLSPPRATVPLSVVHTTEGLARSEQKKSHVPSRSNPSVAVTEVDSKSDYYRRKVERARSLFAEGFITREALDSMEAEAANSRTAP